MSLSAATGRVHFFFARVDFGLWRSYSAVTVSSAGPRGLFKGMTTATSVVIARFPLLLPVRNSVASYGASAVTRTSDRGHVSEVKNQLCVKRQDTGGWTREVDTGGLIMMNLS
jgi:hypothetical protein